MLEGGKLLFNQVSELQGDDVPEGDIDGRVRGTRRVRQYNL
jgi:hypothetical protein